MTSSTGTEVVQDIKAKATDIDKIKYIILRMNNLIRPKF
jgi:hypothetical protein